MSLPRLAISVENVSIVSTDNTLYVDVDSFEYHGIKQELLKQVSQGFQVNHNFSVVNKVTYSINQIITHFLYCSSSEWSSSTNFTSAVENMRWKRLKKQFQLQVKEYKTIWVGPIKD